MLLPFVMLGGAAHAQTIDNIAEARWTFGGNPFETQSNLVSVEVQQDDTSITVFRPVLGSDTILSYRNPRCTVTNGGVATPTSSEEVSQSTGVEQTTQISAGTSFLFQVSVPSGNLDPNAVDQLDAALVSSTGDRETITIFETGVNTGIFVGIISTHRAPPAFASGDCVLGVVDQGTIRIGVAHVGSPDIIITAQVDVVASPFNFVFDSETGTAVSGARIILVDAATGQPATVFAENGTTPFPSRVISGEAITDASGTIYPMGPGQFWFPVVPAGAYRLLVEPPTPYTAPSAASPEQLALLVGANGEEFAINDASFGGAIGTSQAGLVRVDIPLDRSGLAVSLGKSASKPAAQPGDAILYTIIARNQDGSRPKRNVTVIDTPSPWLRLRSDSIRIDGVEAADSVEISADGREIKFQLGDVEAGATRRITYIMTVRTDAPPGAAENRATVTDSLGRDATTGASVRIERESIAGRMTIIGRITAGRCDLTEDRPGIPGVRVMMEDGSFAITDLDGRYHFEGVVPGTHVVQASPMTLPEGGEFVDCHRDTRSGGSAISRFAIGQGGSLVLADFHAVIPQDSVRETVGHEEPVLRDREETKASAASDTDWIALGDGNDGWLTPTVNENPRAPAIRVAIRHRKGQKILLRADGEPVDTLLFEGTRNAEEGKYAVSTWRGVPLRNERTRLSADIINSFGEKNETIEREVFFTTTPTKVEFVPELSKLVADGRTSPTVAVRILDRNNRPLREGISGEFTVSAPYQSAEQIARQQLNQLTGLGTSSARWVIEGDKGIALIELAPTMVSGSLNLGFRFDDGEIKRERQLETWIEPGDIEWTVIGLAEGSIGARSVAENMEREGRFDSDLGDNARVALYAKGRVLGKYLVTLAYDSAKQEDDQRLLGTLDPDAYYTVFGDASSRRFDAASREKLYLRIETATFYALYGDFETDFNQTRLARYNRTATGVKGEARLGAIQAEAFAADIATGFRRDEIQGQGISGPYRLSSRALVANTEQVTLETRDRFRSEVIVSSRKLERFLDYDVDLLSGTITFKEPVLSRDFNLNPQFIVVEYETERGEGGEINAGVRAEWTDAADTVRIGASAITDKGEDTRTNIVGLDMRAQLTDSARIDAEVAVSTRDGELSHGWLVEAQHQTRNLDLIAYARALDETFGVGQQNGAELGRTKIGADARLRFDENFSILGSIWQDDAVGDDSQRKAVQVQLGYTNQKGDYRLGIAHFDDRLADGTRNGSTVLEAGATRRLLDNRLELGATTSIALDDPESADLPNRHRLNARYAITDNVRVIGLYEIADGEAVTARTIKGGFEVTPWQGARAVTSLGQQQIDEYGNRSFAAFGLSQSLQVTPELTFDATIDGNRTIDADPSITDVVNPDQPLASGGQLGQDGTLFEDFTAITLGGAYRKDRWSATARGEYRDGEFANRKGVRLGAIRQLGEGSIVGSGFTWTHAEGENGAATRILDGAIAMAHRPDGSEFAFLSKLEYRSDAVWNAIAGDTGPAGRTALAVSGDAQSRRLLASMSANWSPESAGEDGAIIRRDEYGLFLGARYNFDRFEGYGLSGTTLLAGTDLRFGISERFELGGRGTLRANLRDNRFSYSFGPSVGFVPIEDALLTLGYNFAGFRDEDFSAARETDKGLYASIRLKIDADSFGLLGLGR
ncbi:DUF11 domain-containing protein [Erythrobacter sp. SD-21]|uniref:DUF11 domain-containing protein n=1 Tax=Erythrobacter sp. SD-21 TaxID=161528 RepID=UPI000153FA19|nr:DUF11 domain-containing protein [Erythrobacter sp. SD-21]EDL49985.1 hypothetical protein ED21_25978 [Erythrobacter sp. SD-21]